MGFCHEMFLEKDMLRINVEDKRYEDGVILSAVTVILGSKKEVAGGLIPPALLSSTIVELIKTLKDEMEDS